MSTELANLRTENDPPIVRALYSERALLAIRSSVPSAVNPTRLIRQAANLVLATPKLLECHPGDLMGAIIECAEAGLELTKTMGEAYIVPHWSGKRQCQVPTLIVGWRGLSKLVRQGEVTEFYAHAVRERDEFDYCLGTENRITHRLDVRLSPKDRGPITHFYAVAKNKRGGVEFEVMHDAQVQAIKAASKSKDRSGNVFGPWVDHYEEMGRKTVMRRLAKRLPLTESASHAMHLDNLHAMGERNVREVEFTVDAEPETTAGVALPLPPQDEPESEFEFDEPGPDDGGEDYTDIEF